VEWRCVEKTGEGNALKMVFLWRIWFIWESGMEEERIELEERRSVWEGNQCWIKHPCGERVWSLSGLVRTFVGILYHFRLLPSGYVLSVML
jgi:hypothetical protein